MLRRALHPLSKAMLVLGVLAFISNDTALAGTWDIVVKQEKVVSVHLQPMQLGIGDKPCPERFRPVRVAKEIELQEYADLSVEAKSSEHFLSTENAKKRFAKGVDLSVAVEIEGCAFRRHLLVRSGHATLSGDIGFAVMVPTEFAFEVPPEQYSAGVRYSAQLAGSLDIYLGYWIKGPVTFDLPTTVTEDEVLGVLSWGLRSDWILLVSSRHEKEWMKLRIRRFKMVVLPEDGSD